MTMAQKLVLDRYEPIRILFQTHHKTIVELKNRNTSQLAIGKFQPDPIDEEERNVLHEAFFFQSMQGYPGIPYMHWSGKTSEDKIVLLLQNLGDSLSERLNICGGKFSLKTVCMLGIQILQLIHSLHDKGFVHRKIRMKVFQFGRGANANTLYINNLIQCKNFRDNNTMMYLLEEKRCIYKNFNIFQSKAAYESIEKSRRDDMESAVLLLVYMAKGSLPWSQNKNKLMKFNEIDKDGQYSDPAKVCKGLPKAFEDMLGDARSLQFHEEPNYHWYILKLKSVLFQIGEDHDYLYDWITNSKYLDKKLTTAKASAKIELDSDEAMLNNIEAEYFSKIDLNEIQKKHELLFEKMRKIQQQSRNNIEIIARKQTQENQPQKQVYHQRGNNLGKKKNKPNSEKCIMM